MSNDENSNTTISGDERQFELPFELGDPKRKIEILPLDDEVSTYDDKPMRQRIETISLLLDLNDIQISLNLGDSSYVIESYQEGADLIMMILDEIGDAIRTGTS